MNTVTTALITLSHEGAKLLAPLSAALLGARLYIHESVGCESAPSTSAGTTPASPGTERFSRIADLTASLFPVCRGLVYAAPCGVVVRAIATLIRNKYEDPAVVVIDVGGRFAVSLLSGHEGGANSLAIRVANLLGAEPVITTTTEALKSVIVGIGCRRGTSAERIVAAVQTTLADAGVTLDEVRLLASADVKANEAGLLAAAEALGLPVRFIAAAEIRAAVRDFSHSDFVREKVNLPAVAEPAALLAGRRTHFICRKKKINGITIALAREGFLWSESAPAVRRTGHAAPGRPSRRATVSSATPATWSSSRTSRRGKK